MEIRQPIHSEHAKTLDTAGLRRQFLVEDLFRPDDATLTYSQIDRIIVGGVMPVTKAVRFSPDLGRHTGTDYFLQRRELGLINIGGAALVKVDGRTFEVDAKEALYVGQGAQSLEFSSLDPARPAKLYFNSAPAHTSHPHKKVTLAEASPETLGDARTSNRRTIYKFLVPDVLPTCQLLMGMTQLEEGSLWNTMPCHTHERRTEVYLYFGLPDDAVLFHMMGEPGETRHLVVRDGEAILSPGWSIHSGVGTASYSFCWAMGGENQDYADMQVVGMGELQ